MKLLLASENQGKLIEMRALLPMEFEIVLPSELGLTLDVEETGTSFEENARIKAQNALELTGIPSVTDDSGLCVDALDGAPGIHSKRFGESGMSDRARCELLLEKLEKTEQRSAKFVSVIVCMFPDGSEITASGECEGEILRWMRGDNGFGYDPVFYLPDLKKTMAEISPEEKNRISHRGKSMRLFAEKLIMRRENDKQ